MLFGQGGGEITVRKCNMSARIFQRPKNAMQSGSGRREWVLEYVQAEQRKADPLMGWAGSGDTQAQVQLTFPSMDAARAYAEKKGIVATLDRKSVV
jgi:hypothetical protein